MSMIIKFLNDNQLSFRTEEQIIFYELDRSKIFNEETNYGIQSRLFFKHYKKLFFIFYDFYIWYNNYYIHNMYKINLNLYNIYYRLIFKKNINHNPTKRRNYNNYHYITINLFRKKLLINYVFNKKMLLNITPGVLTKKLNIKEKKTKKSSKIFTLMLKSSFINIKKNFDFGSNDIVLRFKGVSTRYQIYKIISIIKMYFSNEKKILFLYKPNISYNIKFRKKKIKAIKKNIKKKLLYNN